MVYYSGSPFDEAELSKFVLDELAQKDEEWFLRNHATLCETLRARSELQKQTTPNGFHSYFQHYLLMVDYLLNKN